MRFGVKHAKKGARYARLYLASKWGQFPLKQEPLKKGSSCSARRVLPWGFGRDAGLLQ
jgi:hypothetical protein